MLGKTLILLHAGVDLCPIAIAKQRLMIDGEAIALRLTLGAFAVDDLLHQCFAIAIDEFLGNWHTI